MYTATTEMNFNVMQYVDGFPGETLLFLFLTFNKVWTKFLTGKKC